MSIMRASVLEFLSTAISTGQEYNILGSNHITVEKANYMITEGALKHLGCYGKFVEKKPGRLQFVHN